MLISRHEYEELLKERNKYRMEAYKNKDDVKTLSRRIDEDNLHHKLRHQAAQRTIEGRDKYIFQLQDELDTKDKINKDLQEVNDGLITQLSEAGKAMVRKDNVISDLQNKEAGLIETIHNLQSYIENLRGLVRTSDRKNHELINERDKNRKLIEDQSDRIEELEKEVEENKPDFIVRQMRQQMESISGHYRDLQIENMRLKEKVGRVRGIVN